MGQKGSNILGITDNKTDTSYKEEPRVNLLCC